MIAGTVRFDIGDAQGLSQWLVSINRGDVAVRQGSGDADCVIHIDDQSFGRLATGQTVPFAAFLSNEIGVDGSFSLLILLRHIFPGPAGARHPRELADQERRRP
jgi:putative sterol carrier protein